MALSVILSIVGFTAIFCEFFLPGGLFALIGGVFVIAGVSLFSMESVPLIYKIFYFLGNMGITALCCYLALRMLKSRKGSRFMLDTDQEGFSAHSLDRNFFGRVGEAQTDLKPSGHIVVGDERFQAISEGEYIKKGTNIQILTGRGGYYVVKGFTSPKEKK